MKHYAKFHTLSEISKKYGNESESHFITKSEKSKTPIFLTQFQKDMMIDILQLKKSSRSYFINDQEIIHAIQRIYPTRTEETIKKYIETLKNEKELGVIENCIVSRNMLFWLSEKSLPFFRCKNCKRRTNRGSKAFLGSLNDAVDKGFCTDKCFNEFERNVAKEIRKVVDRRMRPRTSYNKRDPEPYHHVQETKNDVQRKFGRRQIKKTTKVPVTVPLPVETIKINEKVRESFIPDIKRINSTKIPKALGPYCHAVRYENQIWVSGNIGILPETGQLISENVGYQARQAMLNIKTVLNEIGCSMSCVVKTTIMLVDINDYAEVNNVYSEFFVPPNFPSRSCFAVKQLPKNSKIEIEVIAIAPKEN